MFAWKSAAIIQRCDALFQQCGKNSVPEPSSGTLVTGIVIEASVSPGEDSAAEITHVEAV